VFLVSTYVGPLSTVLSPCLDDKKKTWADYAMDMEPLDEFFNSDGKDYGADGGPEAIIHNTH
jgi:hypothetical protein